MGLVPLEKLPQELLPGSKTLIEAHGEVSQTPTYLAVGLMRVTGAAVPGKPVRVSSEARARELFGEGSSTALQCIAFLQQNKNVECWALPLLEPEGGAAAVWELAVSGTASEAGTITRYINGIAVNTAVQAGDDSDAVGAKLMAAINAIADMPVEASFTAGAAAVKLTAVTKGVYSQLRIDHKAGDSDPDGLHVGQLAQEAAGAGLVDMAAAFQHDTIRHWNYLSTDVFDSQAKAAWQAELKSRYSPERQIDGRLFVCLSGAVGDVGQDGSMIYQAEEVNSPHVVLIPRGDGNWQDSATIAALWAARAGGIMAIDPAANLLGREIAGFKPQRSYTNAEREELLRAGIASYTVDKLGQGYFERTVTSYNERPDGSSDTSYLDLYRVEVVSRLRLEINLEASVRFEAYKLARIEGDYGDEAAVMSATIWKAFLVERYEAFMKRAWVQDMDGYIASIKVAVVSDTRLEYVHEPRPIGNLLQTRSVMNV